MDLNHHVFEQLSSYLLNRHDVRGSLALLWHYNIIVQKTHVVITQSGEMFKFVLEFVKILVNRCHHGAIRFLETHRHANPESLR